MATKNPFTAVSGLDAGSLPVPNVADPVSAQDAATKNFATNASNLASGTLLAARLPAYTGDATTSAGSSAITLANSGVTAGTYGDAITIPRITVDAKGRITSVVATAIQGATTSQTGVVQLSDATNSTSTTLAATPKAVKAAYDLAAAGLPLSQKGAANGVASLDASSKIPSSQFPDIASAYGRPLAMRVFTYANNGQTYTPTAGTLSVLVMLVGAGGGGGGAQNANGVSMGGGGAAGAFASSFLKTGFSGVTLTIGAGGNGGYSWNGTGVNGGSTSFGSLVAANGGSGGGYGGQWSNGGLSFGGGSSTATAGDLRANGAPGDYGFASSGNQGFGGWGAPSYFGGGGAGGWIFGNTAPNGWNAESPGAGGGGGASAWTSAVATGGKGGDGIIIVYEYA